MKTMANCVRYAEAPSYACSVRPLGPYRRIRALLCRAGRHCIGLYKRSGIAPAGSRPELLLRAAQHFSLPWFNERVTLPLIRPSWIVTF